MFVQAGAAEHSAANRLAAELGLQGRAMWLDAEANLDQLSSRAGVADVVDRLKAANFNTVIVDVKPLSGLVLYASDVAPRLSSVDRSYPSGHDLLAVTVEEGHRAGLDVHAAVNVFSEGSLLIEGGPAHAHPEWQCTEYRMERFLGVEGTEQLRCGAAPGTADGLFLYGRGEQIPEDCTPDSYFVLIGSDGRVIRHGAVWQETGQADCRRERVEGLPGGTSIPSGGYVAVGSGVRARQLRNAAESGKPIQLSGRSALAKVGSSADAHHAVFVNPLHPQVRAYELAVVREICEKYAIDGIVLDRMRYPNIYSDFGALTRRALEKRIRELSQGRRPINWPEDVLRRSVLPGNDVVRGPLFGEWLRLRAQTIRDFLADVRRTVDSARPGAALGVYVGSWYPIYYDVGVNWGSPDNRASLDWWPEGYEQTGYADLVDYLCTGCYYEHPRRSDAVAAGQEAWRSVEAAAEESLAAVRDAAFVYGSLYLKQFESRPDRFVDAVRTCLRRTQGCMLFDLVYVRDYDWWALLEQTFAAPCKAPHQSPGLLSRLRAERPR